MSVRLFHRGARLVLVLRRTADGDQRWWAPFRRPDDWGEVLKQPLALLDLEPQLDGPGTITCSIGRVKWTRSCRWIDLQFNRGSATKRRLVAGALLKAARYGRPGR